MSRLVSSDLNKKWYELAFNREIDLPPLEIELYKRLFELAQIGPSYFLIFIPSTRKIEYVSDSFTSVLGHDVNFLNTDNLLKIIHPEDLPFFGNFETTVVDFKKQLHPSKLMKYKTRYNYRILHANGDYLHILQQSVTIEVDDNGALLRNLVIHTDVSDLMPFQKMKLSFIGLQGEPSYINVKAQQIYTQSENLFSPREKEILLLMIKGTSSKEIAEMFHRSIHTINTHRKNILQKSGCKNLQDLSHKSIQNGWI